MKKRKPRQPRAWKIVSPADKAKRTMGIRLKGRITMKQYLLLVSKGRDGDVIKNWTKHHASKEIQRLLGKAG